MSYTPGPWHRNIRADGKYQTVFAGRNQHVAHASQQKDPAETEANIDLIAAAPALLEALKAVQRAWDQNRLVTSDEAAAIREALKRAKGQA